MTTVTTKEELQKSVRSLCRRIGAEIVKGMAYRDSDFALMAHRLNHPEEYVRQCIHDLIEGRTLDLSTISDLMLSLGLEFDFRFVEKNDDN